MLLNIKPPYTSDYVAICHLCIKKTSALRKRRSHIFLPEYSGSLMSGVYYFAGVAGVAGASFKLSFCLTSGVTSIASLPV